MKKTVFFATAFFSICLALFSGCEVVGDITSVSDEYYKDTDTKGILEMYFTRMGTYAVSSVVLPESYTTFNECKIWYPTELLLSNETYPAVIFANGTGSSYKKYEPVFKHLASWGFIAVGNDNENTWSGNSSSATLNILLLLNESEASPLYGKIDVDNVGIYGHSQGGVGAINAVTQYPNKEHYKAIFTASCASYSLSRDMGWIYDVSAVNIPYFMCAGSHYFDSDVISPLSSLVENFARLPESTPAVMARIKDADHSDMVTSADGYMTAWFLYVLKGDERAKRVFVTSDAEIMYNTKWHNVFIKKGNLS